MLLKNVILDNFLQKEFERWDAVEAVKSSRWISINTNSCIEYYCFEY